MQDWSLRQTKASIELEPQLLAGFADCHSRMGEPERAAAIAAEAIELARRRSTRLAECRAAIIRAAALLAQRGSTSRDEALRLFRLAEQLIEVTGARIYEPLLIEERPECLRPIN